MRVSALLGMAMSVLPALVLAQTPQLLGLPRDIHVGPGDQSDPHLSGGLVAYTSALDGASEIRFHRLEDGGDEAIPTGGALDLLPDVSGSRIVFTRIGASSSAIMSYDVATRGPAVEVAPQPEANRRGAVVGGPTIVWLDFGLGQGTGRPVLAAQTAGETGVATLSDASGLVRDPAVSPDGQVVVWTRCAPNGTGCAIHQAKREAGAWEVSVLAALGESSAPDTNGELVVYAAERVEAGKVTRDIYWQPVGGGPERRLALDGDDANPNVGERFVAFERGEPAGSGAADIVLYDLEAGWLYQLTDTPEGESLNDVSVSDDGTVHVVWTVPGVSGLDVKGMSLTLGAPDSCPPVATGCADPWNRPLLAVLELDRTCGPKERRRVAFDLDRAGSALLCVERGSRRHDVTAAWVWVDGLEVLGPHDFRRGIDTWEREVSLEAGRGKLEAALAGAPGGGLTIRLYGPQVCPRSQALMASRIDQRGGSLQPVPGRPILSLEGLAGPSLVTPGESGALGCSAGGESSSAAALLLLMGAVMLASAWPRTLAMLRVRRRRR